MSSVVTYNFPGSYLTDTIDASVISANPDATTLWLQCPTDGAQCKNVAMTITVGPWATVSPHCDPPKTGTLDLSQYISVQDFTASAAAMTTVTYSLHCDVVDVTKLSECTYVSTVAGQPTAVTLQSPLLTVNQLPLTITAGLDKLQSADSSCPASTTMTELSSSTVSGASATMYETRAHNETFTSTLVENGQTITETAVSEVTSVETSMSVTAVEVTTVEGAAGSATASATSAAMGGLAVNATGTWLLAVLLGWFLR